VAACHERLGQQKIEDIQDLPCEVKQKIHNRDLKRSRVAKELRAVLCKLQDMLKTATAVAWEKPLQEAPRDAVGEAKGKKGGSNEDECASVASDDALLRAMGEQKKCLEEALTDSLERMSELNMCKTRAEPGSCSMGALAPSCVPEEVSAALAFYDGWVKKYVSNELGDKSDEVMAALKAALTDSASVDSVLALKRGSTTDDSLKQAFVSAGEALDAEYEQLRSDALGVFPCSTLISSGRHLLETWQAESAAIKGLLQVYRMLEEDIRLNDECLDSSGKLSKDKDHSVLELRKARAEHKKALGDLSMLKTVMERGEEQTLRFLQFLNLPQNTTLSDLQHSVRVSLKHVTDATFKLSGEIQAHFPEVVLFIGQGLPPDLGALWRPPQSLDDGFDHIKLVQTVPHPVWRVTQGGAEFAIKEYRVAQASDLRTCLKEAAIVYRQRHPAIVEIIALFQGEDKNSFYLQMPWYQHGSLDKWVDSDQRPKWPKVRSVLLDALLGLAHLHDHGVIHSDVKPPNILIDTRERGCLADFDISIDTKVRTSAAHINANTTIRGTQDAWTAGFAAPELISSRHATRHTDIFAFGKTVHAVESRCEPDEGEETGRGQTAELISALTSHDPELRPPAKDAMQTPFFAVLKDVSVTKVTKTCAFCEMNGDDAVYEADEGSPCSEGHFHCGSCLTRLTKDLLKVENQSQLAQREAQVMCFKFPLECRAPGFHAGDLARHLPVEDLQALLKARIDVMNQQKASELEDQFQQRVNEELKRLLALDERGRKVLMARKHIEEEILQMRCPRRDCRRAFYDFDGCFALSCGACKCKFCGWCLADCGDQDAHPHVARCSEKPPSADTYFGSSRDFKDSHKKRCKRKVTEFLASLEPETRAAVRGALAKQLRELDMM
jgi:hypothetical protein